MDEELVPAWERHRPAQSASSARRTPWVIRFEPHREPHARLLCFHFAGAGASMYRTWAERLPAGVELCAIQLPGRENRLREPPLRDMATLTERLLHALAPFVDRPFACFGYSLGALCAFEFARALQRQGAPGPRHLFAAAHRAPKSEHRGRPLHRLPDAEFLNELRRLGGTPDAVLEFPELMHHLLPTLRADLALTETYAYRPEPALHCSITAFGGRNDPEVSSEQLDGWEIETAALFERIMVDGDHFFVRPARDFLIAHIRERMASLWSQ